MSWGQSIAFLHLNCITSGHYDKQRPNLHCGGRDQASQNPTSQDFECFSGQVTHGMPAPSYFYNDPASHPFVHTTATSSLCPCLYFLIFFGILVARLAQHEVLDLIACNIHMSGRRQESLQDLGPGGTGLSIFAPQLQLHS